MFRPHPSPESGGSTDAFLRTTLVEEENGWGRCLFLLCGFLITMRNPPPHTQELPIPVWLQPLLVAEAPESLLLALLQLGEPGWPVRGVPQFSSPRSFWHRRKPHSGTGHWLPSHCTGRTCRGRGQLQEAQVSEGRAHQHRLAWPPLPLCV